MKMARAKLIKLKSDDGLWEMEDHVPIGKEYTVDLDTIEVRELYNREEKVFHRTESVYTVRIGALGYPSPTGLIPTELLEIEGVGDV